VDVLKIDNTEVRQKQIDRIKDMKAKRDEKKCQDLLAQI
jgi:methylmalonyl-CoA mutase